MKMNSNQEKDFSVNENLENKTNAFTLFCFL